MTVAALFAALTLMGGSPSVQDQEPSRVDDVVVTARSPEEQIRNFLEDISLPERSLQTARFYREICVGVINLNPVAAQAMIDRVSEIGGALDLRPGQPGCRPNILIVAADNGDAAANGIVDQRESFFRPDGIHMVRSLQALDQFKNGGAPIRWWHVAVPVDSRTGRRAVRMGGEAAPIVTGSASRLRSELRTDMDRVMVILDTSKLRGYSFRQIADYAAVVAFSQVDASADFSQYDSVLSLFSGDRQVAGLTQWDLEYLQALYAARLNQPAKLHQREEINLLMRRLQEGQGDD
ncbi:hypothetical protein [uncultured Brevundimonas sp.]|uniref:hypothetical protein n=1 Tax=uncultured Brevundimonas sp. TaxID=213418 RepID=UPI0026337F36|nr:hypothetical protein [uncultured Brevundimonas sp.]